MADGDDLRGRAQASDGERRTRPPRAGGGAAAKQPAAQAPTRTRPARNAITGTLPVQRDRLAGPGRSSTSHPSEPGEGRPPAAALDVGARRDHGDGGVDRARPPSTGRARSSAALRSSSG